MTGSITENDLAYYCPSAPSLTEKTVLPSDSRTSYEPTVYYIAESFRETLRWINIAIKRYNRLHDSTVFYQNGRLVWIARDETGSYQIYPLDRNRLRIILTDFTWLNAQTREPCRLGNDLLETIIAAPPALIPDVPVLKGLYSGVLLTAGGRIISAKGYDSKTGLYLTTSYDVPIIPEHPGQDDVTLALNIIDTLFEEFLFETDCDRHNTILLLGTAIFRPQLSGPVPIGIIDKNTSGAGGTLLSQLTGALAYGVIPPVYSATKRKDEFEKIVRSINKTNPFVAIIDNLENGMDWTPAALLSATSGTGEVISRNMGTFDSFTSGASTLYIVNGINVEIRADVTRRMFRIRLVTKKAGQTGYSRTKTQLLTEGVNLHPKIIWAFAVLYQKWKNAGFPAPPKCSGDISEYPEWDYRVRGMLYHAGYTRMLENQGIMQTRDNEADIEGAGLVLMLKNKFPEGFFTPGRVRAVLEKEAELRKNGCPAREELLDYAPEDIVRLALQNALTTTKVGYWLRKFTDAKYSGCDVFIKRGERTDGGRPYHLVPVESQMTL